MRSESREQKPFCLKDDVFVSMCVTTVFAKYTAEAVLQPTLLQLVTLQTSLRLFGIAILLSIYVWRSFLLHLGSLG